MRFVSSSPLLFLVQDALAGPLTGERDRAAADLAKQRRFQQALWTVYASPLNAPKERCGDTVIWKPSEKTPLTALA